MLALSLLSLKSVADNLSKIGTHDTCIQAENVEGSYLTQSQSKVFLV